MPIGQNQGGQNNILLFESGYIFRTTNPDTERVVTVAVHPLVVAPQAITYSDPSRSAVTQTLDRTSRLVSSRGNRTAQISGVFGVEERGYADYRGTGYVRWQRFYNEVVRWSDCRTQAALDELINDLTGSPLIRERLRDFDPARCSPFVNFYDLLNNRRFTCTIQWSDSITARNGGATGNRMYSLTLLESGPIVASKLTDRALDPLFSGQQLFKDAISVLQTYTPTSALNGLTTVPAAALNRLASLTGTVAERAESARTLFGSTRRVTLSPAVVSFFSEAQALIAEGDRIAAAAAPMVVSVDPPPGAVPQLQWLVEEPESFAGISASEQLARVYALQFAAEQLLRMGAFFGLDQAAYADIIATGGASQRAVPLSTVRHRVTATDTPATLELTYGTTFEAILQASGLLPDEALFAGADLTIPLQSSSGPRFVNGLPVFGSQSDAAAWGTDLSLDVADNGDGDFLIVAGPEVLVQGVRFIQEEQEAELMEYAQSAGSASQVLTAAKLEQSLLSDRRIAAVPQLDVASDPLSSAISINAQVLPINSRAALTVGVEA